MGKSSKSKKSSRIRNLNLKATYDNSTVSGNVSITYFEAFKKAIGFDRILEEKIPCIKHHNSTYNTTDILNNMINAVVLGYTRFSHIDTLRNDNVYRKVMQDMVASEKVCRDLLLNLPDESKDKMRNVNKAVLNIQAANESPREVMLDFDDTVATVFGNQEGSAKGYNPRYKGRSSYKEKVASIAVTDEIIDVTLENGRNHLNKGFLDFFKSCNNILPSTWIIKRIRADSAAFDQKNFKYFEDNHVEYVVKAKKYENICKIINYVNCNPETYVWQSVDKTFAVTEITAPLPTWSKARRFILIRKKIPVPYDQLTIDDDWFRYEYSAIVTNIDYMTPEEIFNDYNKRCDIENNIDELKEGFAFSQNSQRNKKSNELFLLIKMIAFNLANFFKRKFRPEEVRHHEIKTLRNIFYRVPGNIVGNGRYRHIRYPNNDFLKTLVEHIRWRIKEFCTVSV